MICNPDLSSALDQEKFCSKMSYPLCQTIKSLLRVIEFSIRNMISARLSEQHEPFLLGSKQNCDL